MENKKDINKMTDKEIPQEMKDGSVWDRRYFRLETRIARKNRRKKLI